MARSVLTCIMAASTARSDAPLRLQAGPPCRATLGVLIWPWWTTRQQVRAVKRQFPPFWEAPKIVCVQQT